ncbi:uncharacterized protein BO96DRAFT_342277 [Aspergillus niger CBS 101883]|uniref:Uncharacterized protein n=2 Tax=Aspergillus niger TaxID=5061 RepID=A5AB33_ASPNC|nr:uncharacterized protein BO96DRAFT_342277 [Aspergillus niger CBS 101883]XP_059606176.1 hypothetical protein An08g08880 [Aspergillus niger]PYH54657.1 hypothetical protein BO96DRAFT_342277 [Aspergillus niger CBS 101883]CAK96667.1 hypothetical protein An08g08880 [Aspergillus niger]
MRKPRWLVLKNKGFIERESPLTTMGLSVSRLLQNTIIVKNCLFPGIWLPGVLHDCFVWTLFVASRVQPLWGDRCIRGCDWPGGLIQKLRGLALRTKGLLVSPICSSESAGCQASVYCGG